MLDRRHSDRPYINAGHQDEASPLLLCTRILVTCQSLQALTVSLSPARQTTLGTSDKRTECFPVLPDNSGAKLILTRPLFLVVVVIGVYSISVYGIAGLGWFILLIYRENNGKNM